MPGNENWDPATIKQEYDYRKQTILKQLTKEFNKK